MIGVLRNCLLYSDPPFFTQGPEFVRKHIFNKHAEKIEEVKKEVAFFNNFLTDAKRPALPEIKPAQPPGPAQSKIRSTTVCHNISIFQGFLVLYSVDP